MAIWFTADTHFGHTNIIKYCNRPFKSVYDMDDALVANWNQCVSPHDTVYHLGDFALSGQEIFHRLSGEKHLIIGNHDHERTLTLPWASVAYAHRMKIDAYWVYLSHYQVLGCRDPIQLHGHQHGRPPSDNRNAWDVGVDVWGMHPVSWDQIRHYHQVTLEPS